MMKKIISMMLTIALTLSLFGCGQEEKVPAVENGAEAEKTESSGEEEFHLGISLVSMTFPYYVRMYDQFESMCKDNGWKMTFVDGNLDASTQLNGIQDMINGDVDAIVVSTWYIDAMEDVFAQCKEKEIPVFVVGNTEFTGNLGELVTYSCGTEHYDAGFLGGKWCAGYLSEQGKTDIEMVIMSGTTEQMKARGQGFVDALQEGGIQVKVLNEYDVSARENGMKNAEDALTAYPELDLIYGVSAQGALGAYDATVGANRTDVLTMGYDGEDEELELIDQGKNYIGTVTQNPQGEAEATIHAIEKFLAGEEFEQIELIPAGVYCKEGQLTSEQILGQ